MIDAVISNLHPLVQNTNVTNLSFAAVFLTWGDWLQYGGVVLYFLYYSFTGSQGILSGTIDIIFGFVALFDPELLMTSQRGKLVIDLDDTLLGQMNYTI